MSCRLFMHHFRSVNNRFVCLDIGTTFAAYFTRLVHKDFSHFSMLDVRGSRQWSLCRYARDAGYVTSYVLILVSLMTMTAISVDRLLALLLGLRYKQIVTLKRTYIIVTTFWVLLLSPLYVQFFISL